jgi:hypothetical protein
MVCLPSGAMDHVDLHSMMGLGDLVGAFGTSCETEEPPESYVKYKRLHFGLG